MVFTGEQIMPIVKVTRNFQVTIPVEVREQLRIELGDLFEATVHNENILLTPKVMVDKKSIGEIPKSGVKRSQRMRKTF